MGRQGFPALSAGLLLLLLLVVFFPVLFFGRVISPLDTVANDPPWRGVHPPVEVANPDLEEAATSVLPLQLMARETGLRTAVWNPYLACGGPGWLAWSVGVLSPTVAPALPLVRPQHLANAVVLLRILLAFAGTWLLLRRSALSADAAAIGAVTYALSGPLVAHWLWPSAGTASALPLLLWALDRAASPGGSPRAAGAVAGVAWLAFLAGGAPGPTLAGAYLAGAWYLWRLWCHRGHRHPGRVVSTLAGLAAGTAVLAPSLVLWWRSALGWGVLQDRPGHPGLGLAAFRLLVEPFLLGDSRLGTFSPPAGLEDAGFHDLCLTVGSVAAALALLGLAHRRPGRWFWGVTAGIPLAAIAWQPAARALALAPGLGRIDPLRYAPVLALALASLAAAGWSALEGMAPRRWSGPAALAVGLAMVLQQGLLAGHITTYLKPDEARLSRTPGLRWLAGHRSPWDRIAPLFETLPPDTASALGFEDIRSCFASPAGYRAFLRAIDPQSWDPTGRRIVLNGATIDLTHPYLAALGARWVLEPPELHLVEYGLGEHVRDTGPRSGQVPLRPGLEAEQVLTLPAGTSRLALNLASGAGAWAELEIGLFSGRSEVERWRLTTAPDRHGPLAWLDLPVHVPAGRHTLSIRCLRAAGDLALWTTGGGKDLLGPLTVEGHTDGAALALSFDTSGYALAYEGPDVRIWENRRALPRFWIVGETVSGTLETLLAADPPMDLSRRAVVAPKTERLLEAAGAAAAPPGKVLAARVSGGHMELEVELERPGLLVSSLQRAPVAWFLTVDGRARVPVTVNGLFVGANLDAGRHRVVLRPGLPPAPWAAAVTGCGILGLLAVGGWRRRRR